MDCITQINFESAYEFMDMLSARSGLWEEPYGRNVWIFRGHSNANWKLLPSALRLNAWEAFEWIAFRGNRGDKVRNFVRLIAELKAVAMFAQYADRQGLPVPGFDHTWVGDALSNKFNNDILFSPQGFPLPEWRPLFGMAQHYGIPTRLLDWTESPYTAAFFAASEAANRYREESSSAQLAVWALKILPTNIASPLGEVFEEIRAPWASNPNLRAQKGLFTLAKAVLEPDSPADMTPLEEAVQNWSRLNLDYLEEFGPPLYCLRLPISESPILLKLLYSEGFSASTQFPGYYGVVQELKDLDLHKKNPKLAHSSKS